MEIYSFTNIHFGLTPLSSPLDGTCVATPAEPQDAAPTEAGAAAAAAGSSESVGEVHDAGLPATGKSSMGKTQHGKHPVQGESSTEKSSTEKAILARRRTKSG